MTIIFCQIWCLLLWQNYLWNFQCFSGQFFTQYKILCVIILNRNLKKMFFYTFFSWYQRSISLPFLSFFSRWASKRTIQIEIFDRMMGTLIMTLRVLCLTTLNCFRRMYSILWRLHQCLFACWTFSSLCAENRKKKRPNKNWDWRCNKQSIKSQKELVFF